MVQSIQYHKYPPLYHVTVVEAEELAEKYWINKKEKDNPFKGMKIASKKNAGIVVKEPVSCHDAPQSSWMVMRKKDKTNYSNVMKQASKKKTEVDLEEQVSHQQTLPPSAKNMSDIIKEENYC